MILCIRSEKEIILDKKMSFSGRLHCESMLGAEQHFRIAASYGVGIRFRRKVMPGVVRVVLRNKKRRTAALLFPRLWYQPPSGGRVLPLPKVQEPAATSLAESEAAARTAGATGMAQPHQLTFAAGSAKGLFVYQRLGCRPLPAPLHAVGGGRGPFLSMAASPLWLFSGIWGQRLYFTPSVGPVDSSEGEFYCWSWCKGQVSRGRCGSMGNTRGNVNNEA